MSVLRNWKRSLAAQPDKGAEYRGKTIPCGVPELHSKHLHVIGDYPILCPGDAVGTHVRLRVTSTRKRNRQFRSRVRSTKGQACE